MGHGWTAAPHSGRSVTGAEVEKWAEGQATKASGPRIEAWTLKCAKEGFTGTLAEQGNTRADVCFDMTLRAMQGCNQCTAEERGHTQAAVHGGLGRGREGKKWRGTIQNQTRVWNLTEDDKQRGKSGVPVLD